MINYVICNPHRPPLNHFLFSLLLHIYLFSVFLNKSSSQISSSALYVSPVSALAACALPTAEDVHAQQRCCVIPLGWGASETGGLLMVVRV